MKPIQKIGLAVFTLGLAFYFSGCYEPWHKIEGNHNVVTEIRSVPMFHGVSNRGSFDVYIIPSDEYKVVLEAESNLLPFIRTGVSGNTLYVETKDNLRPNYPMKLFVYTNWADEVKLSGSGSIHCDPMSVDHLDVQLSGSGYIEMNVDANDVNAELSGSGYFKMYVETNHLGGKISGSGEMEFYGFSNRADLNISGSGSFHAYDLPVNECYASISGSGNMYVNVNNYLNVNISGSGNLYYLGNPAIDSKITGSGSVIHP